jgi:hypothetical protein
VTEAELAHAVSTAILGVDTLWGGDVLHPSGTGRFIADSWFSNEALPEAYTHAAAVRLRATGGITGRERDLAAADAYIAAVDVRGAVAAVDGAARGIGGLRGAYLAGLAQSLEVMWDLAQETIGRGERVPYERCVLASTGELPGPSHPDEKRRRVADLLARAGHPAGGPGELLAAVDAWRRERLVPSKAIALLAGAFIAQLDAGTARHVVPHLSPALHGVPRANISFLPIEDAFFSGSMNYVGRARNADGSPQYEATYEINASLEISVPEFAQLVSHEVVPGHVTTFALLQARHARRELPFEATVLTMCTRGAALFEGLANNALLMAHGATEVDSLPEDLQIGMLLSLLQDDAKNQASWLTWGEGTPREEVAAALRLDCLVTHERADKLSGSWGRHPLLGRMLLPAYRAGAEKVAALRRAHSAERIIPALFGCEGLVDVVTIDLALGAGGQP